MCVEGEGSHELVSMCGGGGKSRACDCLCGGGDCHTFVTNCSSRSSYYNCIWPAANCNLCFIS